MAISKAVHNSVMNNLSTVCHRIIRTVENEIEIYETIKQRKGLLNICYLKLRNCSLKNYEIISHDNPLKFSHVTKLTLTTIATILKKKRKKQLL